MVVKFKDDFGVETEAFFKLKKYTEGGREAIQMYELIRDDGGEMVEPYAMLTVNLPEYDLPKNKIHGFYCFIDINNCPWAERLLFDNGIGIPTGHYRTSGFVHYPIWFIFTSVLKRYRYEQ